MVLLTGFPSAFGRSPDCTILRSLLATNQNRKTSRTRDALTRQGVRKQELCLFRTIREIIDDPPFPQRRPFLEGTVKLASPPRRASIANARNLTNARKR